MRILINGIPADLPDSVDFELSIGYVPDPTDTGAISYKSSQIELPLTPHNASLLGHPQSVRWLLTDAPTAEIHTQAGVFRGKVLVTDINEKKIGIVVVGGNGEWILNVKTRPLRDLDTSDWNHPLNVSNVQFANNGLRPYVYDICYRGAPQKVGELQLGERLPAVRVADIVKKIFDEAGVNFVSDTLQLPEYQQLFLLCTQSDNVSGISEVKRARFEVQHPGETRTFRFVSGSPTYITFWYPNNYTSPTWPVIVRNDEEIWPDGVTSMWSVPETLDNMVVTLRFSGLYRITRDDINTIFCNSSGYSSIATVRVQILRGNDVVAQAIRTVNNSQWGMTFDFEIQTPALRVAENETFSAMIAVEGYVINTELYKTNIYFQMLETPLAYGQQRGWQFESFASPFYAENETVNIANLLPDISQAEFLSKLSEALDLVWLYDSPTETVRAENRMYAVDAWSVDLHAIQMADESWTVYDASTAAVRFKFLSDDGDGLYKALKKPPTSMVRSPVEIPGGEVSDYEVPFADTAMMDGHRVGVETQILAMAESGENWNMGALVMPEYRTNFELRLVRYMGTKQLEYKYHGQLSQVLPVLEPVPIEFYSAVHSTRLSEMWGKTLKFSALLTADYVNRLLVPRVELSMRTPVTWKGDTYKVQKVQLDAEQLTGTLTLVATDVRTVSGTGGQFATPESTVGTGVENILIDNNNELIFNGLTNYAEDLT